MEKMLAHYFELIIDFLPHLLSALLTLAIGFKVIKMIVKAASKALDFRNVDPSLNSFLKSLLSIGLKVILIITAAGMIGFQTTSLVAIVGAASLAVGMALQGSLANFAGGVLLLIFKPFKVGDVIKVQGEVGKVREIQIFSTHIVTGDQRLIILPNALVSNGIITNCSRLSQLVSIDFPVHHSQAIQPVKDAFSKIFASHPNLLTVPAPSIVTVKIEPLQTILGIRAFTSIESLPATQGSLQEALKLLIEEQKIRLPDRTILS